MSRLLLPRNMIEWKTRRARQVPGCGAGSGRAQQRAVLEHHDEQRREDVLERRRSLPGRAHADDRWCRRGRLPVTHPRAARTHTSHGEHTLLRSAGVAVRRAQRGRSLPRGARPSGPRIVTAPGFGAIQCTNMTLCTARPCRQHARYSSTRIIGTWANGSCHCSLLARRPVMPVPVDTDVPRTPEAHRADPLEAVTACTRRRLVGHQEERVVLIQLPCLRVVKVRLSWGALWQLSDTSPPRRDRASSRSR
jgi:hypothetical protein